MPDSSSMCHRILLGTHDFFIHTIEFDPVGRKLSLLQTTKTAEHPSWLTRHPAHHDIVYSNGWIDGKVFCNRLHEDGKVETLDEAVSGGVGPTHLAVTADGRSLLVAHYGEGTPSGLISTIPLSTKGRFQTSQATEESFFHPPRPCPWPWTHSRLDVPHPHQVIALKDEILTCDLGSNKVWRLRRAAGDNSGWEVKRTIKKGLEDGDGPRHAALHPSGNFIYILNEVSSVLSVHTFPSDGSDAELVSRHTFKPPHDLSNTQMTGAEILLLPPLHAGDPSVLICTNRFSTSPSGDALAVFNISQDGREVWPASEPFYWGVGNHIRALGSSTDGQWIITAGRDKGGVVILQRIEDGTKLEEVARLDIKQVVVPLWLD